MGASPPEGTDTLSYDGLDRLVQDARVSTGLADQVDTYTYNALGALKTNAGTVLDDQRPKLAGGGTADAAIPNTLSGQAVTLNAVGNVTTLRNVALSYNPRGQVLKLSKPATNPTDTEAYAYDSAGRRIARIRQGSTPLTQFFVNEGANLAAIMDGTAHIQESWLYEGVDRPLRINVRGTPNLIYYYEVDLTGNVRRLMRPGGSDAGGYRYAAFGTQMPADTKTPAAQIDQPLRWKGRLFTDFVPGAGLYDVRARMWSPEMGSFTSIDEYAFHDQRSTLWGWPRQNPAAIRDPSGHCGPQCLIALGVFGAAVYAAVTVDSPDNSAAIAGTVGVLAGPSAGVAAGEELATLGPRVANLIQKLGIPIGFVGGQAAQGLDGDKCEEAVEDAATMNTWLESGATVRYSNTATAIGDDPDTLQNFARSVGASGHDVIVHGGFDAAGEGQFVVNGNFTNAQQIADAILGNPAYQGGPINLVTCYGSCGPAQALGNILGTPVNAAPGPVDLDPATGLLRGL